MQKVKTQILKHDDKSSECSEYTNLFHAQRFLEECMNGHSVLFCASNKQPQIYLTYSHEEGTIFCMQQ